MHRKIAIFLLLLVVPIVLAGCLRGGGRPTPTPAVTPPGPTSIPSATIPSFQTPAPTTVTPTPTNIGVSSNPFGVMLSTTMPIDTRMSVARNLGVAYYRPGDIKVDKWKGTCADCEAAQQAGLKLLLTLRNGGGLGQPSTPPADLESYKTTVSQILDKYPGAMAVVENEEN